MNKTDERQTGKRDRTAELTETERHRLLLAPVRRAVLEVLAERAGPVTLEALTQRVTERNVDVEVAIAEKLKINLHHLHLPMLADAGVVNYDRDSKRVECCHPSPRRLS